MARARTAESPSTRSKTAAIEEITQGVATFQSIITAIEDFSREGFPYRDGARAKAELQIRETVRRLFGERSPEYQAHRTHKLKISTPAETAQSVLLLKSFIAALERKYSSCKASLRRRRLPKRHRRMHHHRPSLK